VNDHTQRALAASPPPAKTQRFPGKARPTLNSSVLRYLVDGLPPARPWVAGGGGAVGGHELLPVESLGLGVGEGASRAC
jgi:hypothetical protein